MTKNKGKCLGFWDEDSKICDWEDEAGIKPILEIKMRKTFPCIPVSVVEKAIKKNRDNSMKHSTHYFRFQQGYELALKDIEKELGLSEKKKQKVVP